MASDLAASSSQAGVGPTSSVGLPARDALIERLALREAYRETYWRERDPILGDRLLWRAQAVRHTVHLLPGQTILELGSGTGHFTYAIRGVTCAENPITAVTFQRHPPRLPEQSNVERIALDAFPGPLAGRAFDCIVAMDLLDAPHAAEFLARVYDLLAPGGELVCYESNPWNPALRLRAAAGRLFGRSDPRSLLSRPRMYELLSEIGFIRVYSVFNDFVYAPLTPRAIWFLRNASILLENAPVVSKLAGSILLHGQKPPRKKATAKVSLFRHEALRRAVSVVIPARNEEMNVEPLVEGLLSLYGEYLHEIIVVNDNSTDQTGSVLEPLHTRDPRVKPLHRRPPGGVGRAIADGLRAATGRYVLTMDCDFQHLLPELRDLFDVAAQGADVVVGSRFSRHSVLLNYPFPKIVANRAFHTLARTLVGHRFRDVTNNLKLMRREVVSDLQLRQPGFSINAETGLQPYLLGYHVQEAPISWIDRTPGMGASSFKLVTVGGGYWRVLLGLALKRWFNRGPYRALMRSKYSPLEEV